MKGKQINFKILVLGIIAIATALFASALFTPARIASADPGTPVPPKANAKATGVLEKFYQRELKTLDQQKDHLAKANGILGKAQDYLDEQKADGKDVSKLLAVLDKMKDQVARAQSAHDQAASILSTHVGFNDNGQVTHPALARQTVNKARQSIQEAHRILSNLTAEFHRILKEFRGDDKGG